MSVDVSDWYILFSSMIVSVRQSFPIRAIHQTISLWSPRTFSQTSHPDLGRLPFPFSLIFDTVSHSVRWRVVLDGFHICFRKIRPRLFSLRPLPTSLHSSPLRACVGWLWRFPNFAHLSDLIAVTSLYSRKCLFCAFTASPRFPTPAGRWIDLIVPPVC